MRRSALMAGGVITSEILELTVYPAIYLLWKKRELAKADAGTLPQATGGDRGTRGKAANNNEEQRKAADEAACFIYRIGIALDSGR